LSGRKASSFVEEVRLLHPKSPYQWDFLALSGEAGRGRMEGRRTMLSLLLLRVLNAENSKELLLMARQTILY